MENNFAKIFNTLKKSGFKIFGPGEQDGETHILELEKIPEPALIGRVADRPWKYLFMPPRETLYIYEGGKPKAPTLRDGKWALFGMGLFDCKALELYDKVFESDIYYKQRRKNIFIIGYSPLPVSKIKTPFFEPDLSSAVFDIFIEAEKFYVRGKRAERILKSCGVKYKILPYKKNDADKKVAAIKTTMDNSANSKLWEELGEICLACGKCTIACPTCFCFDFESIVGPDKKAERCSGNCFYDDFTRIAGDHKFLNNPKEKIFFWYYHKFVRLPKDYGLPGCVDCSRCTAVCPVGINIAKNINRLLKGNNDIKNKNYKFKAPSSK